MKLFRKGYDISLNRVHDTLRINENGETLPLTVSADPMRIVAGLNKAQKKLSDLVANGEPTEDEMRDAAEFFAAVIFGKEQAEMLMAFYNDDAACVINVCGQYFRERLANKINKMQKKLG